METVTKPLWLSKTMWVNVIALGAAVAASFGLDLGLTADVQAALATGVMAVANIILRLVTKEPVSLTGSAEAE